MRNANLYTVPTAKVPVITALTMKVSTMHTTRILGLAAIALGVWACGGDDGAGTTGTGGSGQGGMSSSSSSMGGMASSAGGGGNTGSAGGGGSTSSAGGGGMNACPTLSDDFEDPNTLGCWQLRHQTEGTFAQYDVLDIDQTVAGHLAIQPTASGWYGEDAGVLVFKEVEGDFVVEVDVIARNEQMPQAAPVDAYHSAGLMVRDPASGVGTQNWLMYNVGYQEAFVGTEGKTTVDSSSVLTLTPGQNEARLRICRVGSDYTMYHRYAGETAWTEDHAFPRADLPATLQVGLIMNAWPPDAQGVARNVRGEFAEVTFGNVSSTTDCTADITSPR